MKIFIAIGSALIVFAGAAAAQQRHVELYREYNAALEAGDVKTAVEKAESAWRAAEEELGDTQTTAILAYNYATLIYVAAPERAAEPLERVVAIAGEDDAIFGDEPPGLMLAYVSSAANGDNKGLIDALRDRLRAADDAGRAPNVLSARGWFHVGSFELRRKRYDAAAEAIDASLRHYRPLKSAYPAEAAGALIIGGVSKVAGRRRSDNDIIEAHDYFNQAITLFPPQRDIETFDQSLAVAIAWSVVTAAAAATDNPGRPALGSRIPRDPPSLDPGDGIRWTTPHRDYEQCGFEWKSREAPEYPQSEADRGLLAGVLVGYHLDGTLVTGARILAEVPHASKFGENTLEAVESWELERPASPECSRNRLTTVQFVLSY